MATTLQSPGVQVVEKDASITVVGASTSRGGAVGVFQWGPVMTPILVDNEDTLVSVFGKPNDSTFSSFFNVANFLAYSRGMYVIRASTGNLNAVASGTAVQINNSDSYDGAFSAGQGSVGAFAARYPGAMGNSILVSIADSATFSTWAYKDLFNSAPGTSDYAASKGGSNDELHIVVLDAAGRFSGTPGTVLERFAYVSKGSDAISYQGLNNYYANVIRNQSNYVYWMDHPVGTTDWGTSVISNAFDTLVDTAAAAGYDFTFQLSGGTDDNAPTDGELQSAWDIFKDTELYDISLFPVGTVSHTVAKYVVDNIGEARRDCVVFVSATLANGSPIFGTSATKLTDATAFKTAMGESSYAVFDSGFKYQYDKYNDKYRWVALNSDIAGLAARVDQTHDTWYSPAGYTKGQVKSVTKLAWNPNQTQRDALYKQSINSVVTFANQGTVLFGDKTGTTKPSAFDRINVRRLFLNLEKSIARMSKYQLFDFNDEITRQQFIAAVEPYLRGVQGRRGISSFKVICDTTNNTTAVVSANEFAGTIIVVPNYSINAIVLTFVASNGSVSFDVAAQV
jgi:hypothetical protein